MYQVMVVDDEPMAASLIVNIIKQKYNRNTTSSRLWELLITVKKHWS